MGVGTLDSSGYDRLNEVEPILIFSNKRLDCMRYQLNLLEDDKKFEELVVSLCQEALGIGAQKFAAGKDGGRDSVFNGTANHFPSAAAPWKGKFIIQAKFTSKDNASCSDSDFKSQLEKEELPRIKRLKAAGEIDNYLIFTNRKSPAITHASIKESLIEQTGINNLDILGGETICSWLAIRPPIVNLFGLDKYAVPLRFYEKDLKEVIMFFDSNRITDIADHAKVFDEKFISKEEKNAKNKLSQMYFQGSLTPSMAYFPEIDAFLGDPKNAKMRHAYRLTVQELQSKILTKRHMYGSFEEMLMALYDYLLDNHETDLADKRDLILIFLHFMYYSCDIGIK